MVLPKDIDAYLTRRFYDPKSPGSFTSADKLYKVIKREGRYAIPLSRIQDWARGQDILSLHKTPKQKQKIYRRIISPGIGHLWDCDLLVLNGERFVKANKGFSYILVNTDVFSRKCYAEPVKNKGGQEIVKAFKRIFDGASVKPPAFLRSDKGSEFSNKEIQKFFKERGIRHYFANTNTKANFSERLVKTLKRRLFQLFQKNNSYSYLNKLQDIVRSYNNTVHSSIGIEPAKVTAENQREIWNYQYVQNSSTYAKILEKAIKASESRNKRQRFKFVVGDTVRIAYYTSKPFHRAYDQQFSGEVFTVKKRKIAEGVAIYYLKDYNGDEVKGHFYNSELTRVRFDPDALFKVDKVLKTRTRNGVKESQVTFESWPPMYKEWIRTDSLVDLTKRGRRSKINDKTATH